MKVKAKVLLDEKNNGGSVLSTTSSSVMNQVSVGTESDQLYMTTPVSGVDSTTALGGGTFAYNSSSPVAKKLTTMLSGVSNDVLLSGAAQPGLRSAVHKIEGITTSKVTTAMRLGHFNYVTGKFDPTTPSGVSDSFGADDAVVKPKKKVVKKKKPVVEESDEE